MGPTGVDWRFVFFSICQGNPSIFKKKATYWAVLLLISRRLDGNPAMAELGMGWKPLISSSCLGWDIPFVCGKFSRSENPPGPGRSSCWEAGARLAGQGLHERKP